MLKIDRNQWRVYLCRQRIHHGLVGFFFVGFGGFLIWHDRHDFPWIAD